MQITRFDVAGEDAAGLFVATRLRDFDGAGDVDLVDADVGGDERPDRRGNVFKFDGLMANVVTDAEMLAHHFESTNVGRAGAQTREERKRFGGGLDHAERLGFDGEADQSAGLVVEATQTLSQLNQSVRATIREVHGMLEWFEAQRHGRDAPLNAFGQQCRQHAGARQRVVEATRLRPIGEVDVFLHTCRMKVSVREGVQRVARQPARLESVREPWHAIGRLFEFSHHRRGEPQPGGQFATVVGFDRQRETVETVFDFGDRSPRMNIGAIAERQ